jgi:hypothetical protein
VEALIASSGSPFSSLVFASVVFRVRVGVRVRVRVKVVLMENV